MLGIPVVIISDQGSQFAAKWFQTLCGRMGIRQAFSQAHRPQGNGRAEMAGKQIITLLRLLHAEQEINWVEALPRAVRLHHDMIGESGVSPYEAVFGRERNSLGLPSNPLLASEDAQAFMDRMEDLDRTLAHELNQKHSKAQLQYTKNKNTQGICKKGEAGIAPEARRRNT